MALLQCDFFSQVLGLSTSMNVLLPQPQDDTAQPYPTLYLLHGMSDDHTIWLRRTSIERYAEPLNLAVVMPQVHLSFYTDMEYGNRYWTFLSEELPQIARSFFPLSADREHNFTAGLSMGGYGALKWALSRPDQFAAAASLSGATDIHRAAANAPEGERKDLLHLIFGSKPRDNTDHDLYWLLKQCDERKGPKPRLFQCCGTEDFLYQDNLRFRRACEQTSLDYTYMEGPGAHEWSYWDAHIQHVLDWLF